MRFDALGCKCEGCPLRPAEGVPNVPPIPKGLKVIAVAQSGRAYRFLWDKALYILGIPSEKIARTQLMQCRGKIGITTKPEYDDAEKRCQEGSRAYLAQVAKANPAAWIFAQGEAALRAATRRTGIARWLGGPLPSSLEGGGKVLPSYDPVLLRTPRDKANTPIWLRHLKWVWGLATGDIPEWTWPKEYLEWSPQCKAALERIARAPRRSADIETAGVEKDSGIRCISFATREESVCLPWDPQASWHPLVLQILADSERTIVWQNGGFDRGVLRRWGVRVASKNEDLMLLHAIVRSQEFHGLAHIGGAETWAESWKAQFHNSKDEY